MDSYAEGIGEEGEDEVDERQVVLAYLSIYEIASVPASDFLKGITLCCTIVTPSPPL